MTFGSPSVFCPAPVVVVRDATAGNVTTDSVAVAVGRSAMETVVVATPVPADGVVLVHVVNGGVILPVD